MHDGSHPRSRKSVRPGKRQRRATYLGSGLLFASGILWLVAHYFLPLPEFAARHPLETWAMRIHGGATLFGMAVFGSLWSVHLLPAWRQGRHQATGVSLGAGWLLLALTGYGLYYLSDEAARSFTSNTHLAIGLAMPIALILHVLRVRRGRPPG